MTDNLPEYPNDFDVNASLMSFVIYIWREKSISAGKDGIWRGHITAIPDGKRQYFLELKEIPTVLAALINEEQK